MSQIIKNSFSLLSIILFLISYIRLEAKVLVFVQVFISIENSVAVILIFFTENYRLFSHFAEMFPRSLSQLLHYLFYMCNE
jgi:hypothetical protein